MAGRAEQVRRQQESRSVLASLAASELQVSRYAAPDGYTFVGHARGPFDCDSGISGKMV